MSRTCGFDDARRTTDTRQMLRQFFRFVGCTLIGHTWRVASPTEVLGSVADRAVLPWDNVWQCRKCGATGYTPGALIA